MRRWFALVAAAAIAASVEVPAQAAPVVVSGSIDIVIGTLPPLSFPISRTQVDVHAGTLTIPAGIAAISGFFEPISGFPLDLITGIVVTAANAPGSFSVPGPADGGAATVPGGGFGGVMPMLGVVQVKGALAINVPLSVAGVGGSVNAGGIVVEGAPWTTGMAKVTTTGAPMAVFSLAGSQSGRLGDISSTVTLVTPAHVNAAGLARLPVFAVMTLRVIPEPGTALLIGAGAAGLVALRQRMRD